jgi:hypothetical protein
MNVPKATRGMFITFDVTPQILGSAFAVAAGIGIAASLAPSFSVWCTSVVQGLKTLD